MNFKKNTKEVLLIFLLRLALSLADGSCSVRVKRKTGIVSCTDLSDLSDFVSQMSKIKNDLAKIDVASFELSIAGSRLNELDELALDDDILKKLKKVALNDCGITKISENCFGKLAELVYLDLSDNYDLDDFKFLTNIPSLETFIFNNNNLKNRVMEPIFVNNVSVVELRNCSLVTFNATLSQPKTVRSLDLSLNALEYLNDTDFTNLTMKKLDLSYNNIQNVTLSKDPSNLTLILKGNSQLKEIRTTENFTINGLDVSAIEAFQSITLSHLKIKTYFNLENDYLPSLNIEDNFLDHLYKNASANLNLFNTNIAVLPKGFFQDFLFKTLNLSYNHIQELAENLFNRTDITSLDLSGNRIKRINKDCFGDAIIGTLLLSNNSIGNVGVKAICDQSLKLENFNLDNNVIETIENDTFSGCTYLQSLNLSHNPINQLATHSFVNLPRLTSLDITIQNISEIINSGTPYITQLNIRNTPVLTLKEKAFAKFPNLKELRFFDSSIEKVDPRCLDGLSHLEYLDARTLLKNLDRTPDGIFKELSQLEVLDLSELNIGVIGDDTLKGLYSVLVLNISSSNLTSVNSGAFGDLKSVIEVRLDNNLITHLPLGVFRNLKSLRALNLSNNLLTELEAGTFSDSRDLSKLDLSNNRLISLRPEVLLPLEKITFLNLENNMLHLVSYMEYDFQFSKINGLEGNGNAHVAIQGNIWDCDHLSEMISFFDQNDVSYDPINGGWEYDTPNINGIMCSRAVLENEFTELFQLMRV